MRDENKTKAHLIEELAEMRQRIAELEAVETERKRAEERFRSIFENTTIGLYRTTPDGHILMANPALVHMLGYSSFEELAQQNLEESGYEPGYLRSAFKQRIESEGQIIGLEAGWLKRDGGTVFVRESVRAIRDEAGNTLYYEGTAEDVTERKRAEEALQESEERFRTVANFTYDWEYWISPDRNYVYVSPSCERITGYGGDEFLRDPRLLEAITHPDDRVVVSGHIEKELESSEALSIDFRIITRSGEERWIAHACQPVYNDDGSRLGRRASNRDITERKRAEEALREAGERYRAIFEQAADSIVLVDAQTGTLVEFNDRAHENLGYTRQEFQKLKIPDFEIIESAEEVAKHIEKIVKEGADAFETKHRTKDGEIRDILVNSRAISVRGRDFAQSIWRDITERVRAEEALEQRAAQLALLNDVGEKIAAVLDLDSVLDRAARLVQESFGYHHVALFTLDDERGELVMRARAGAFTDLFPPDHRLDLDQGMVGWVGRHGQSILANDVDVEPRYVNLYPDVIPTRSELSVPIQVAGEVVGALDVQSPQLDAFDENDVMAIETLADQMAVAIENARLFEAEQRKRQEAEALREASLVLGSTLDVSQMLDQLLEQIGRVIPYDSANVILIEEGTARVAHQRWYEQFGTVEAAAALHLLVEQMPNLRRMLDTHRPHIIPDTQADPGWVYLETSPWVRAWAGAPIVVRGEVIGFFSLNSKTQGSYALEQAELLSAFATDAALAIENAQLFTEVQRHADELEQRVAERTRELAEAYEQLKELDRLKSKFVTDVSHELRTPAANIKLYLHLLQRGKPEKRSHYLAITNDQVNRLTSLIEDILDLSRLDMAESKVEFAAVDLNAVVEQVVAAHRPRAEAASLELTFEPKVALPPVLGEHNQLSRVVANLVGNAVNYTPAGQVRVSTHLDKERQRACLEVQDTGRGIEEEDLAHIFERFYRGREAGSSAIPGTGLGLAVVKEIVELHGGTIKVESQVGQGSTFTVWLPLEEGEEQSPVNLPGHREAW